ncbi:hypothetical protein Tco_0121450 [Tanacetum coccineum]
MCEPNNGYNWERMTGGRTGRGGGRTRGRSGDQGNGGIDGQGGQVGGQGTKVNDGVDGVPDFSTIIAQQLQNLLPAILAQGDVRNVTMNNDKRGCTSKEFLACNPKEYDGKGGAIVYTRWIEKMESVQDMSGCRDTKSSPFSYPKNKIIERYIYGLAPQIRKMVAVTEPTTIQKAVQKAGTLTDEAIRNGSLKRNTKKRGNGGEPSIGM